MGMRIPAAGGVDYRHLIAKRAALVNPRAVITQPRAETKFATKSKKLKESKLRIRNQNDNNAGQPTVYVDADMYHSGTNRKKPNNKRHRNLAKFISINLCRQRTTKTTIH